MAVSSAEHGREEMHNDFQRTVFESMILVRDQILANTTLHESKWHYIILNKQSTSTGYHMDPLREETILRTCPRTTALAYLSVAASYFHYTRTFRFLSNHQRDGYHRAI